MKKVLYGIRINSEVEEINRYCDYYGIDLHEDLISNRNLSTNTFVKVTVREENHSSSIIYTNWSEMCVK